VAVVMCRAALGADMIGFGGAEFCIEIEGLLPVVAALARVADRVMTVSDAIMGAGLLGRPVRRGVPGFGRRPER
jgi:hypothetical protein